MRQAFLAILCVLLFCGLCSGQAQDPTSAGSAIATTATQKYGSKAGLNENLFKPIMSSGSQMKTMDGSKEFNAQLLCPSSQRFMEILIKPGSSGDITTLIVSQDTNFDGNPDYAYQSPFVASGVCTNGIISCNPGTWNYCRALRWVSDTAGKVSLEETLNTNLGGCYCINNSCGNNLALANIEYLLKSIGGGVVAAVHKNNARYVISGIKIDGTLATFYGQNAANCTTTSSATVDAEGYYYNPYNMDAGAQSVIDGQKTDPTSMYSLMEAALNNSQAEIKNCSITRSVATDWSNRGTCQLREVIQNHCEAIETDSKCKLREETVDTVTTLRNYNPTGLTPTSSCKNVTEAMTASCAYACPSDLNVPCIGDPPTCTVNGGTRNCQLRKPIESVTRKCAYGMDGSGNGTNVLDLSCATIVFAAGVKVTGSAAGSSNCHAPAIAANCSDNPSACSGCPAGTTSMFGWTPYCETRWECVQYDESSFQCMEWGWVTSCLGSNNARLCVQGVRAAQVGSGRLGQYAASIRNVYSTDGFDLTFDTYGCCTGDYCDVGGPRYQFSGYVCPLGDDAQCMGVPGYCNKTCSQDVCKEWWRKDRVYTCENLGYDFSDAKERVKTIKQSVQDNTSTIYYTDYRKTDSGAWVYENTTTDVSHVARPSSISCETACKTRKLRANTSTTVTDTKTDFLTTSNSYDFYYKTCSGGTCPVETGEEVIKNCQCINDFAEAALIMQILRSSGQDFICSSGTAHALQ